MTLNAYKKIEVLVTGGTGFIGKNLVDTLNDLGANITVLSRTAHVGSSNILWVKGDIRDEKIMNEIVKGKEVIFNLAAQVSHMDKSIISYDDLDTNCRGQLTLLEACRQYNQKVKIVFSSTRMVYGENGIILKKEDSREDPVTIYGIHKLTAEKYHLAYNQKYNIRSTILRIGNPYGDGQHFSKGLYSLPGWFMNQAIKGETTEILSSGKQMRDYIYIKDLIEVILRVGISKNTDGQIYNCGTGSKYTFGDMVRTIQNVVGNGKFVYSKLSEGKPVTDSYTLDVSKIEKDLHWKAKVDLTEGIKRMYEYAKKHPNI